MAKKNTNTLRRIEIVQRMVGDMYEPGNQSKSKAQAYRQQVSKVYPMGERTFWRYMGTDVKKETEKAAGKQMKLPFDKD